MEEPKNNKRKLEDGQKDKKKKRKKSQPDNLQKPVEVCSRLIGDGFFFSLFFRQ